MTILRVIVLGFVAGMRSQMPLALLSFVEHARAPRMVGKRSILSKSRSHVAFFCLLSLGELIGDKLPFTPNRISAAPLSGRILFGGLAGAIVFRQQREPIMGGVVIGGLAAIAGSFAGYHARRFAGQTTTIPDPVWGAVEDTVALAIGLAAFAEAPRKPGASQR